MPVITLPTLHAGQIAVYNARGRFNAVRCGRRWGKDVLQNTIAGDGASKGKKIGLFAPEHKQLAQPFDALLDILQPIKARSNRTDGMITTSTGGVIDFWTLNDNELAGRGREYDIVCINEGAFTKSPQMQKEIWEKSIRPTLLTRKGRVWVFSTPSGTDPDNFFHRVCHDKTFMQHHAPTSGNPLIGPEELELERQQQHPLVFRQEYEAEFVDWSGVAFFSLDRWMEDNQPTPMPANCEGVFALVDSALKSGKEHDGTGVLYCALQRYLEGHRLVLIDYDLFQIDADLLPGMMPAIYRKLDEYAVECRAIWGSKGLIIEDKGSGTIMLQHAARHGMMATPVPPEFVALGKDERSLAVSKYHYQGLCKIARPCYEKVIEYKGSSRNHLVTQVTGFRLGDKDAHKRADDLHDCYTAALSVTFGTAEGF